MLFVCALFWLQTSEPLGPLVERAARALQAGDYATAERDLQAARRQVPNHPAILANLGVLYTRTERYGEAVQSYQQALRLHPGEPRLLINLGLAYFKQEDYSKALSLFRQVPGEQPQARSLEAACLLYVGRPTEAIESLTKLRNPDSSALYFLSLAYLKTRQPEKARASLETLFRSGVSPAQADYLAGKAQFESGHFDEAVGFFRRALERDPGLLEAEVELAKTLVSLRQNEEAEQLFLGALRRQPGHLEASYYLGALYTQLDRFEEALPRLEHVVKAKPGFWGAHYYLGRVLAGNGRHLQALPHLEQATQLNPDEMSAWYQLARTARALGQTAKAKDALARYEAIRAAKVEER